jgi:hypothetical protein
MKDRITLICVFLFAIFIEIKMSAAIPESKFHSSAYISASILDRCMESPDSDSVDSAKKYTYLDLGTSYINNNNFAGQFSNVEVQPAWTASASLNMKSGFDASLNYSLIQNSDTTFTKATSNADLQIGYSLDLLKYFNLRFSVIHTFQPKNSSSLKKGYDNSLSAGLGYDFTWLTGNLSSTYMLGNKTANKTKLNSLSCIWANNLLINIQNFLDENNSLSFQPGFEIVASDQRLYNDYLLTALSENPKPIIAKLLKKRPNLTVARAIAILKAKTISGQKFQTSSFGLNMPLVLILGDYTITLTPSAFKPLNQPVELVDSSWKFTIELGVIYSFSW